MAFNAGEVYVLLGGRLNRGGFQQFDRSMKESAAKASAFEKALGASSARSSAALHKMGTVAKYGAAGGILALGGALVYSVKKAADFEQQLSSLGAVSNANGRQMQAFKKQAMDAGAATKYSALEAAQAQTELAKGGLSVTQILKGGLKGALALAAAGELDLADAASFTVNAMKLFKLHGDQATHVADAMATAANTTTADVQDFGMALTQGGGAARSAGYSFNETMTILEALAGVGVKNSDAGTSMKTALLQLIGPTKQQAAAAQQAGLSFLDQAGQMKSVSDISAMLRSKTGDMTKAQRTALFQTLAGTDGFRTLLALYDAGPGKLDRLEQGLTKQGTAADVAAKKQDNLKGKLETLQGSIETAAITVGTALLPVLSNAASDLTDFVNKAAASGDLKRFGQDMAAGIGDVIHAIPDIISGIGQIGSAAGAAVGAVAPLVDILLSIDPHILAGAALGFAAFKVAQFVAPGIQAVASGIGAVSAAARTAPSLGAFAGDLAAMVGTPGLIIGGLVALGAAIVVLSGKESDETAVAHQFAAAKRDEADATREAQDAILASADAGLAEKQAVLDNKRAQEQLNKLRKEGKTGTQEYRDALLAAQQTSLRVQSTRKANTDAIRKETDTLAKNVDASKKDRDEMVKTIDTLQHKQRGAGAGRFRVRGQDETKALAAAQKDLNKLNQDYIQKLAVQKTAEESRQRLMHQSTAITEQNAVGVSKLIEAMGQVPAKQQGKLLLDDQGALSKLGNLVSQLHDVPKTVRTRVLTEAGSAAAAIQAFKALQAGVPSRVVTTILTQADSAKAQVLAFKALLAGVPARKVANILAQTSGKAEVDALRGSISALQSKTVTITTQHLTVDTILHRGGNAAGRPAGMAQTSMVGEGGNPREYVIDRRTGRGYVTSGPQLANLGPDDYVIPTENRYRGRAVSLLAMLARDLNVPGFKGGKGPTPRRRYAAGGVPFEDVQSRYQSVAGSYHQAQRDAKSKDKATAARGAAQVKKLAPKFNQLKADYNAAKRTHAHTANLESDINVLSDRMDLDDRKHDTHSFDHHRRQRVTKLLALQKALRTALRSPARGDSKRSIQEQLAQLGIDLFDTRHAKPAALNVADPSVFTKKERDRLDRLNADLAVAALTDTPDDDRPILEQILGIDQAALGRAMRPGTSPAVLQAAAEAVKATRDQLKNLTSDQPDTSPDLQAQLDQANARLDAKTTEAAINAAALGAGLGAQPIVHQTINTLHPGDPRTLRAIGSAAVGGISHTGGRASPRVRAGI